MNCPKCKNKMLCNESRQVKSKAIRYRTYKCAVCGTRFATREEKVEMEEAVKNINQSISYIRKHPKLLPTALPTTENPVIPNYLIMRKMVIDNE